MPGRWGFCGGTYVAISENIDNERAVNLYCEKSESPNAKTPIALLMAPGKRVHCTLPEGKVPCQFFINGRMFAAASNLYEIFADGTFANLGALGAPPVLPTQIEANETQLLILNNGALFVLTLATNAFVAVDMAQFDGPVSQICFVDGFFIATLQNSHTFQVSAVEDGTTWNGLDIATVSEFPDNIVSMKAIQRQICFQSNKKTLWYYNAGAGFPPFIPIQGAFTESGSGAMSATTLLDDRLYFLSQDERGALQGKRTVGYGAERISTHAVELRWQKYATATDAVGYAYQENGHTFWELYFPTANATWVYDVTTGLWHERGFWNVVNGVYTADRSMCHAYGFGMHLVGDWASGNIYQLSSQYLTDAGNPIRIWRRVPSNSKNNEFTYFKSIEFDVQTSTIDAQLKDGNGQPRPPQLMLAWSDDAGLTFGNTHTINCQLVGQGKRRAKRDRLGRARKRVWDVTATDPVPWYFADAYIDADPEVYGK